MSNNWDAPSELPNKLYIGGKWVAPSSGEYEPTVDPATGKEFASIALGNEADVLHAIENSKSALKEFRKVLPAERGRILTRAAAIIRRDKDLLARVETLDSGKPLREAYGDVETAAGYFEYYAGMADKLQGDSIPLGPDFMSFTLHEPVGVTAHIIPWNFPLVTTVRGAAPALAAGCTCIIKPALITSLTALMLGNILKEAGLPDGVYNVITGKGSAVGGTLTSHPDIAHVTFTGSVSTGQTVMRAAADSIASTTMELGGKSPVVVLEDADIDAAVEGTMKAIFMNAGQVCSSGSRLVIERSVHAQMMEKLVAKASALKMGHGLDDADLGPLVSSAQLNSVSAFVEDARARGCSIATGGNRSNPAGMEKGFFMEPTIIDDLQRSDKLVQEEIFGPVLAVQIVDNPEDAMVAANDTPFGLCGGIYTKDITKAMHFAREMEAGQIFINQYFAGGIATPFGGVKNSGFGREKGLAALSSYYQVKCITTRI
ncbi:MAG: aldehyde dehydrogenase family protein [Rhodospirillales bacterium]|jgi:aldehyde dehydrogenase (NAD+)|nr:aldehyde dehydrogenase family protein [Rhodospirillales bacterium]